MRLLVDISVWSLALRRADGQETNEGRILRRLIAEEEDIFLLGIILQEILQGIRNKSDFLTLREYLDAFPTIELKREDYVYAASLKNTLMKKGVQASTIDALIASVAIEYDLVLFTTDQDFHHIARHTKLRLFRP